MNEDEPPIPQTADAPFTKEEGWHWARVTFDALFNFCPDPVELARQRVLTRRVWRAIATWLAPLEAFVRRLLLLEALALPIPNVAAPGAGARANVRASTGRGGFASDQSSDWQVPVALASDIKQHEPQIVPDDDWNIAQERFEIIRPLLDSTGRKRADVEPRATETGKHANTLYKWIGLYQSQGRITALLPMERKDKGTTKLSAEVEAIIQSVIENEYLTKQNKSIAKVCQGVRSRCLAAKLETPHNNTIRNRVAKLSEELKISRRRGKKVAEQQFSPIQGEFPGADFPLAVVQMDHTKLDIILVDDIHRSPIGRPWITLAMDVFSRVVAGSYVSFDPPGALSLDCAWLTGYCRRTHGSLGMRLTKNGRSRASQQRF